MELPVQIMDETNAMLAGMQQRISQLESQLRAAETTATAMGLAYSEIKQENERLREALETLTSACEEEFAGPATDSFDDKDSVGGGIESEMTLTFGMIRNGRRALANHFGDANKMVSDGKEGA